MIDDRRAALLALVRVCERVLEGGPRNAGEGRRHFHVAERQRAHEAREDLVARGDRVARRHPYFVEEDLSLRQRALAELLQRLALAHTRQIEGHEDCDVMESAALGVKAVAIIARNVGESVLR